MPRRTRRDKVSVGVRKGSGVKVGQVRKPSVFLATEDLAPWEHAMALGAALWCRGNVYPTVGVTHDPYGIWGACRFLVSPIGRNTLSLRTELDPVAMISSAIRHETVQVLRMRGYTQEAARQLAMDVPPLPAAVAFYWHVASLIAGSQREMIALLLSKRVDARGAWMVPARIESQVSREMRNPYILLESGLPDEVYRTALESPYEVVVQDFDPHWWAGKVAGTRCVACVARSHDAAVLAWSLGARLLQWVDDSTRAEYVLLPEPYLWRPGHAPSILVSE